MAAWSFAPLFYESQRDGKCRALSLCVEERYSANASTEFETPEEVEAFIRDLRKEKDKLWPATATA